MSDVRTFYVKSPMSHMVPLIFISAVTVTILFFALPANDRWIILLVAGVLLIAGALAFFLNTRARLEITSRCITYYGAGFVVTSPWDNLIGWKRQVLGASEIDCLLLAEPGMTLQGAMKPASRLMPVASVAWALQGRLRNPGVLQAHAHNIPVGLFDPQWQHSEIGALIRQYAPPRALTEVGN